MTNPSPFSKGLRICIIATFLGGMALPCAPRAAANDVGCDECAGCESCVGFGCAPTTILGPALEEAPGYNLYWHDPWKGFRDHCDFLGPDVLGYEPAWYGIADALVLTRDTRLDRDFAAVGPSGPTALSSADFQDEYEAGVRIVVGHALSEWYRVEGSWFGNHSWDAAAAVRNTDLNSAGSAGNLTSPFTNFGNPETAGFDFNNFVSIRFDSSLNSGEVGIRRRLRMRPGKYEASFFFGARYLRIDETFAYNSTSLEPIATGTTNVLNVDVENEMIGVQLGYLGQFLVHPRGWIDFEAKGALMHNSASQSTVFTTTGAAAVTSTGSAARERTAFVGDLSLGYNYNISPHITLRAGYNALWVTGAALGVPNFQADSNILTLGPAMLDHSEEAVYHGPHFGIVVAR